MTCRRSEWESGAGTEARPASSDAGFDCIILERSRRPPSVCTSPLTMRAVMRSSAPDPIRASKHPVLLDPFTRTPPPSRQSLLQGGFKQYVDRNSHVFIISTARLARRKSLEIWETVHPQVVGWLDQRRVRVFAIDPLEIDLPYVRSLIVVQKTSSVAAGPTASGSPRGRAGWRRHRRWDRRRPGRRCSSGLPGPPAWSNWWLRCPCTAPCRLSPRRR
jgi:hypothetical protein